MALESTLDGDILTNIVTATTRTTDPTPVNTASVTTTVQGFGNQADLGVVKATGAATVTAGERITYTLTVTNSGPSAATNVRVLDLSRPTPRWKAQPSTIRRMAPRSARWAAPAMWAQSMSPPGYHHARATRGRRLQRRVPGQ